MFPWTLADQPPLSSTTPQSLLKFTSIELVMLSNHLILCHSLLLLPSIFPGITVFSNEVAKVLELQLSHNIMNPISWILKEVFQGLKSKVKYVEMGQKEAARGGG